MSRTPIRRALMSLESSGFIKHYLEGESELYFNEVNHFNNLILQPPQNDLIMETMTKLLNRFAAGSIKYFQIRKNSFLKTLAAYEELVLKGRS
ncbi:hypothetical protein ACFCYN_17785 [Gottfriedia sp. NPDC056225]|uniref:hypothetical protein n=1 Tax=Gottfriedia sp. NPDC056225 TaxID=3345751 RepID=UPI0035E0E44B